MYVSQLPDEYKALAEKRAEECEHWLYDKNPKSDDLSYKFSWFYSFEGFDFWEFVHLAKTEEELPRINTKEEIKCQ